MGREPLSRIEKILSNIVGEGSYELDPPLSDAEEILIAILNDETIDINARDRFCTILLCILNGEEYTGVTMSRAEEILKCISEGEKYEVDEWTYENHLSRVEQLLTDWANAEDPEYSKTVSGVLIHVLDAVEKPAESLVVTMEPKQAATPFIDTTTKEPYLSKTASTTGNKRYLDKIVGGTVCWNQLIQNGNFESISGWKANNGTIAVSDNILSYTIGNVVNNTYANTVERNLAATIPENHILFIHVSMKLAHSGTATIWLMGGGVNTQYSLGNLTANEWKSCTIVTKKTSTITKIQILGRNANTMGYSEGDVDYVKDVYITDITQLFSNNPSIADYIYSLSSQAERVSYLNKYGFFLEDYYPFNAGELISAKPTGFSVGSNTYALGGVDLRGLFKLDSNNNLYCDGDIYPPSGQISERYGIVDLGLLSWTYVEDGSYFRSSAPDNSTAPVSGGNPNILQTKYTVFTGTLANFKLTDKTIYYGATNVVTSSSRVVIKDSSYSDAATFKTAMDGVYLIYLLATPTTSSQTPYQNPVTIENGDTESFTDTRAIPIPVGNESHYAGEYEIEGTTGVTATRTGFNQWDEVWETGMLDDVTAVNRPANNRIRSKNYIPIMSRTTYYFNTAGMNMFAFFFDEGKNLIPDVGTGTNYTRQNNSTFTTPNNAKWMRFYTASNYGGTYNHDICINIHGDKDGTYESYVDSTTYSVTFTEQGTVYGGTVDIVTGALSITWGYIASYNGETLTGRWISSLDAYAEGTTPTTGAEVAYELASPITAQLTPQEVQMLLGENYFWAENGESMELTYLGSNPAMMMQSLRAQNNLLKKQGLPTITLKPNDPIVIKDPIVTPIKPKI